MKIYLALLFLLLVSPALAQRTPDSDDLQFPEQDTEILEGEVVWLQGAILRGNPQAYRNPEGPLAAYEQGILDASGQLWTILDTPEGREMRYNPDLRGKRLKVRGWLHPQSKIVEVKEWRVGKHKVRVDEDYEPPKKLPFDPTKAETIESLPPLPLRQIEPKTLDEDLWMQGEGYDLGLKSGSKVGSASPTAQSMQLKKLLDELDKELGKRGIPAATPEVTAPSSRSPEPSAPVKQATGESRISPQAPAHSNRPPRMEPPAPKRPPGPPLTDEEGNPVTRPEDFDEALRRELIQEITPKK